MGGGLDALGHDPQSARECGGHDGGEHDGRRGVLALDQRSVDLQLRDGKFIQLVDRCVPRADVVEGDAHAERPEILSRGTTEARFLNGSDSVISIVSRPAASPDCRAPAEPDRRRPTVGQLHRRDIHRHLDRRARLLPGVGGGQALVHHERPDLVDAARLLREGDEDVRRDQAALRMQPPAETLHGDDGARLEGDLGLEDREQLPAFARRAHRSRPARRCLSMCSVSRVSPAKAMVPGISQKAYSSPCARRALPAPIRLLLIGLSLAAAWPCDIRGGTVAPTRSDDVLRRNNVIDQRQPGRSRRWSSRMASAAASDVVASGRPPVRGRLQGRALRPRRSRQFRPHRIRPGQVRLPPRLRGGRARHPRAARSHGRRLRRPLGQLHDRRSRRESRPVALRALILDRALAEVHQRRALPRRLRAGRHRRASRRSRRELLGWSSAMAPVIMGNPDRPELGEDLTASFCSIDPAIARHFAQRHVPLRQPGGSSRGVGSDPGHPVQRRHHRSAWRWAGTCRRRSPAARITVLPTTGHVPLILSDASHVVEEMRRYLA